MLASVDMVIVLVVMGRGMIGAASATARSSARGEAAALRAEDDAGAGLAATLDAAACSLRVIGIVRQPTTGGGTSSCASADAVAAGPFRSNRPRSRVVAVASLCSCSRDGWSLAPPAARGGQRQGC
jgi:hypothetical protein